MTWAAVVAACVFYAGGTRGSFAAAPFVGMMMAILGVLAFSAVITYLFAARRIPKPKEIPLLFAGSLVFGLVASGIYYSLGVVVYDLAHWTFQPSVSTWDRVFGCLLALVFGVLLFSFRFHYRTFYGLTEAIVGLAIAYSKVRQISGREALLSFDAGLGLLTASVYLIVRGFDNMFEGVNGSRKDRLIARIQVFLERRKHEP